MTIYATITSITSTPEPNFSDYSEVRGTARATTHDGTAVELNWERPDGREDVRVVSSEGREDFFEAEDILRVEHLLTEALYDVEAEAVQAATEVWTEVWTRHAVRFEVEAEVAS